MKIHGYTSSLVAHLTELKDDLKDVEKQCKVTSDSAEEKTCQVEEY